MGTNKNPVKRPTITGGMRPSMAGGNRSSSGGQWIGDKHQVQFRSEVLKAAIADRIKSGRKQFPSLDDKDLAIVENSNGVKTKSEVADEASEFLSAAKDALKRAREAAQKKLKTNKTLTHLEEDALLTEAVKISGYRSVDKEKKLWSRYFPGYYNRTIERRNQTGDPHGTSSIRLMVRFISNKKAPPGFSKHTLGVSIDFYQKRYSSLQDTLKAKWIKNSTKECKAPGHNDWWYQTWLYTWIHQHAQQYGFKELTSEAWHYDFVGKKAKMSTNLKGV